MGQSLGPLAEVPELEGYDSRAHTAFTAGDFHYQVLRKGDRIIHRESRRDSQGKVLGSREAEIRYVLGSGSRGRSYLIDLDGELFQSPIAWFSQAQRWDLAPGYEKQNLHFEKAVKVECLFCHSNRVVPLGNTLNRYEKPIFRGHAIGCERCHGPGAIHVREQEAGAEQPDPDTSIVNPAKLAPVLRDAVCEQCHLQGVTRIPRRGYEEFDYRPGLPLHQFLAVFVKTRGLALTDRAVSQVQQMMESGCFRKSNGKLGCISCHDPHALPATEQKTAFYRRRCLECHGEEGPDCKLSLLVRREKNQDDCVSCHMPRFESVDVAHTAVTDHRVLRRLGGTRSEEPAAPDVAFRALRSPLVHFHEAHLPAGDSVNRELGIALTQVGTTEKLPTALQFALPRLQETLKKWPDDIPVLKAKGIALAHQARAAEALKTFERILSLAPEHEEALAWAGYLAEQLGPLERAEDYWHRAVDVNPCFSGYHVGLARVLFQRERWQQAAQEAGAALQMNPARLEARRLLLLCHLRLGDREKVRVEWEIYQGLRPPDLEEVRKLIEEKR